MPDPRAVEAAAVVAATLLSPILAVQVQKWLEPRREQQQRRRRIFATLMATRATKVAESHVQALNAVPVEFYGSSRPLRDITEAWKLYLDHLNKRGDADKAWGEKGEDLFVAMLGAMSNFLGYHFDPVELRREAYLPRGHAEAWNDQEVIRRGLVSVLSGERPLPMAVHIDEEALAAQKRIQAALLAWLNGEAAPRVRLDAAEQARPKDEAA